MKRETAGNSPFVVDAAMIGRVRSRAENADKELGALHRAAAFLTGQGSDKSFCRMNSGRNGLPSDTSPSDLELWKALSSSLQQSR